MTIPAHSNVLIALGYKPLIDFDLSVHSDGSVGLEWKSGDAQPSEASLQNILDGATNLPSGLTFAQWLSINGGNATATFRRAAKEAIAASTAESALVRAALALMVDEFNLHSARFNALLDAIDAASSLATLKTAVASINDLPTRTASQLKTAAENKIDAGDAD